MRISKLDFILPLSTDFKYDSDKTSLDEVQKKIASVGYDTEKYKADDEVYNNLHHCCKYNREN